MNEPVPASTEIETSLEDLYEHAPCGYLSTTLDGVIIRVNETFLRWSGYRREQLLGAQFPSILSSGGQLFYESRYLPVLHLQGEAREVALDLRHASGDSRPILVNGAVVNDEHGKPAAIRTAVFEYGGRKQYEKELLAARRLAETSESRLRFLHDASRNFSTADTDARLAEELTNSVREAFAAPEVSVYLLDDSRELDVTGASLMATALSADEGPVRLAMRGKEVVSLTVTDASHPLSPEIADAMRAGRVETLAVVPMFDQQEPLGAFVMFFKRTRVLEQDDIDLAETFARQAAEVLTRLRVQQLLEHMPFYDELTGLATRRLIRARVNEAIDQAHERDRALALVAIDLDGFRAINDTFGRAAGDEAVIEIVERISESVQGDDLIGRFGGDEFVIVRSDVDGKALEASVDRLLAELGRPLRAGAGEARLTSNIGVALYSGIGKSRPSSAALFESVDEAMHRAKALGKNRAEITSLET